MYTKTAAKITVGTVIEVQGVERPLMVSEITYNAGEGVYYFKTLASADPYPHKVCKLTEHGIFQG